MKTKTIAIFLLFTTVSLFAQININEQAIVLKTETGDIYGTLKIPISSKKLPVALIIAGSGPTDRNGNNPAMVNNSLKMLSDSLYAKGIASVCFDKRGIAASQQAGKNEADLRFDDYVNDASAWVDMLNKDERFSQITVIGHSEGSLIGMVAANKNKKISKFVSIAGAGQPAADILKEQLEPQMAAQPQMKEQIFGYIDQLQAGKEIDDVPETLYSLFRPSVQPYMISWFKFNPQNEIATLTIPTLILQGTTDIQVTEKDANLLAKANPKARKVVIENMNHVLKNCDSTDQQTQLKTYTDANLPINSKLCIEIVNFINH